MSTRFFSLFVLAASACDTVTPPEGTGDTETAAPTADTGSGELIPEDYTFQIEAGATSTRWKYDNGITAALCATITEVDGERTLRIYGATVTKEFVAYCEDSGAFQHSVVRFNGYFINTVGEGRVTIRDSVTGTIVSGDTRFNDDQVAETVIDVTNPKDPTIAPARLTLTSSTTPSELTFTFAKTP